MLSKISKVAQAIESYTKHGLDNWSKTYNLKPI